MASKHHLQFDFNKWTSLFPIETFEKTDGPRQFGTTKPGDPLDLWKVGGTPITSPADLCQIELVRHRVGKKHDLGDPVPVDIILWHTGAPTKPYLTKLGGVPHREAAKSWPTDSSGEAYTFVAQFCFLDSKDITQGRLPGDVMLVFFKDAQSCFSGRAEVQIEWADQDLAQPLLAKDCPKPRFAVPELSAVLYRCNEYPDSGDVFEQEGHSQYYLFATTQSTKIGRETFFIQNDPRRDGKELLCVLNSLMPQKKWPFVDLPELSADAREPNTHYEWGKYRMMFGDVGCMYFLIDENGNVTCPADSY